MTWVYCCNLFLVDLGNDYLPNPQGTCNSEPHGTSLVYRVLISGYFLDPLGTSPIHSILPCSRSTSLVHQVLLCSTWYFPDQQGTSLINRVLPWSIGYFPGPHVLPWSTEYFPGPQGTSQIHRVLPSSTGYFLHPQSVLSRVRSPQTSHGMTFSPSRV